MRSKELSSLLTLFLCVGIGLAQNAYNQNNLTSDLSGVATHTDSKLVNPWGIAFFPGTSPANPPSPIWVSDNNSGFTTLYDPAGNDLASFIIPPPPGSPADTKATPTGIVANTSSSKFSVAGNPSFFIFDTEDGTISGWTGGPAAVIAVDNSTPARGEAVYKGLALIHNDDGDFLLAANFRNGKIEVYDQNFNAVELEGRFHAVSVPRGYAPFGVHVIGDRVFVTYAKQNPAKHDPVIGPGRGFVNEFDVEGRLVRRFAQRGVLDAPWGVVLAPASGFGTFSGALLIGNFGDGIINAFNPKTGALLGQVSNPDGTVINNPGLWAMVFGSDINHPSTMFFDAGILSEAHGLLGTISVAH